MAWSKARRLADLMSTSAGIPTASIQDDAITSAKIADDAVVTAAIADDAVTDAKSTITAYNDSNIRKDVATLALHNAVNDNKVAHSLGTSFIDVFQDSAGIDATSTTSRHSSEYVYASDYAASAYNIFNDHSWANVNQSGTSTTGGDALTWESLSTNINGSTKSLKGGYFSGGAGQLYTTDTKALGVVDVTFEVITNGGGGPYFLPGINKNGSTTPNNNSGSHRHYGFTTGGRHSKTAFSSYSQAGATIRMKWDPFTNEDIIQAWVDLNGDGDFTDTNEANGTTTISTSAEYQGSAFASTTATTFGWDIPWWVDSGVWQIKQTAGTLSVLSLAASGNFTSVSQSAGSTVSKAGLVVTYKNNSGTATINTDLVAQISTNNGTNWTTLTLADMGTFSTGVKMAGVAGVTISNASTQPKYKILLANQSSGSKETYVEGVALLY